MRHYDLADRTRNRFVGTGRYRAVGRADVQRAAPASSRTTSTTASTACRIPRLRNVSLGVDYHRPSGLGAGGTYNYERYAGLQRSHEGDSSGRRQFTDPLRDWTADSTETVHYFSIYVNPPRIGQIRRSAFTSRLQPREGQLPLRPSRRAALYRRPISCPTCSTSCSSSHLDVRHRLSSRLAALVLIAYEPLSIYDFAFDPSVVNGIVQPSSLVMGYTCIGPTRRTRRCSAFCITGELHRAEEETRCRE